MTDDSDVLSAFHDTLRDAIYVFEDDVLVDANARVGEVAGVPTDELFGVPIETLLRTYGDDAEAESVMASYRVVADGTRSATRTEATLQDADGDPVPVDIRFSRYEDAVVGVLRNLTESRERRAQLEALTGQLEVLNRVLRHDIRNDMNVVEGWLGELQAHVDDSAAAASALDNVTAAVSHTVELTEQARDLAEVITEGGEMPVRPMDLETVLTQQVQKARQTYPDADFEVDCHGHSLSVRGNEMLSSVFDNLLGNAVIHNDRPNPTVTIDVTVADDDAVISVADDGPGIPEEMEDVLFGRGEKAIDSPGTGMGLYLVDQLVSGYGGSVSAEPNDPRGSVFVVRLPLAGD